MTSSKKVVAPLAGAWIEMFMTGHTIPAAGVVAPLAGAWIEIWIRWVAGFATNRRSPRGSVD